MRKSWIMLIAVTAVVSTAAHGQDDRDRGPRSRAERSNDDAGRAGRPERPERQRPDRQRPERATRTDPVRTDNAPDPPSSKAVSSEMSRPDSKVIVRHERVQRADRTPRTDRLDRGERPAPVTQEAKTSSPVATPRTPSVVPPTRRAQGGPDSLVEGFRQAARNERKRRGDDDHGGHDDRHHGHDRDNDHHWSKDWRQNDRYDWWNYRNRYRSLYRLGRYYDPYGWGYRRWSVGYGLWPSHYSSNFWLNDPWRYRLPPAYGSYRWVRYYDDALLVDIYTGHVVDVVYNFFW